MIIKKHLVQYGKGFETPKLTKWQRAKTGVGKVGRGIAKVPKTVVVATGATAVALPKAAIAGTVSGIGSTLYSPVRLAKAVGKTLYHGSKGLSREAKRFIAWRRYKAEKAKQKVSTGISENNKKLSNLKEKLRASTGRVKETRKQIGKSLLNVGKTVTGIQQLINTGKGAVESLKHTARSAGSFGIIGSETLQKLQPKSTVNIILGTSKTKKVNSKNSNTTLSGISTKIENLEKTNSSKTKLTAEDYLKLDRLKKLKQKMIDNVNKIRNNDNIKFDGINILYSTDSNKFKSNLSALENSVNNLIKQIPTKGMFDSNRVKLQNEYYAKREELKVYKAVKIFKENPSLFPNP